MKKYLLVILAGAFLLFLSVPFVLGVSPTSSRTVKVTTLNPPEGEERDFYLVYGEIVEVSGVINGDVIAVGGEVNIDAEVNGDIIAVGGEVNISGKVTQNVRVVGGQVTLSGETDRNVLVVSGDMQLTESSKIAGGLLMAGGVVSLNSPIDGEVKIMAGEVILNNSIGSDTEVWSDSISLSSESSVDGNLTYYGQTPAQIDESASVSGKIARGTLPAGMNFSNAPFGNFTKQIDKFKSYSR
ncbi:hypothetical protein KKB40_02315, partial [Patescibacteria group bacterium]|nr:hypothetical protein [Patescibacteria group bacterium]